MKSKLEKKISDLKKIAEEIKNCKTCKKYRIGLPVPGEGNPNRGIMLIGEAGGPTESKIGKPFVGRSGKFLTQLLASIGIKREDVYITSLVKYYPGKRALTDEEIEHGKIHLIKQIDAIKPKLTVLLGNAAQKALIGNMKVSEIHGKTIEKNGIIYFPTFHPAAGMRFPKIKKKLIKDFKKLEELLKRVI